MVSAERAGASTLRARLRGTESVHLSSSAARATAATSLRIHRSASWSASRGRDGHDVPEVLERGMTMMEAK